MTLSKTFKTLLTRIRRTITRTLRNTHLTSTKLTISFPPFVKLEIATETDAAKPSGRRRRSTKLA